MLRHAAAKLPQRMRHGVQHRGNHASGSFGALACGAVRRRQFLLVRCRCGLRQVRSAARCSVTCAHSSCTVAAICVHAHRRFWRCWYAYCSSMCCYCCQHSMPLGLLGASWQVPPRSAAAAVLTVQERLHLVIKAAPPMMATAASGSSALLRATLLRSWMLMAMVYWGLQSSACCCRRRAAQSGRRCM